MDDDSGSSPDSSRRQNSLCGLSVGRKSTRKESQSPGQKSSSNASRKSQQKQSKKDLSPNTDGQKPSALGDCGEEMVRGLSNGPQLHKSSPKQMLAGHSKEPKSVSPIPLNLESSPNLSAEASSIEAQNASVKKPTLKQRWKTYWQSRRSSPNESVKTGEKDASPSGEGLQSSDIPGSARSPAVTLGIKPNTVSQRRAAFENLSGDQQSRSSPAQPSGATGKKVTPGKSSSEDSKLSSEERPSCSYHQSAQPEKVASSSAQLESADESGSKSEKKKESKRSLFRFFKRKRSNQENVKTVQDKSKGKDKKKNKKKKKDDAETCEADNNEDESFEATGSSHVKKTKTLEKDAKQEKTGKLLHEQNISRDSMIKAIRKGVEKLNVPEQSTPANVKSPPVIDEATTSAKADSRSDHRLVEIPDNDDDVFFPTSKSNAKQLNKPTAATGDLDLERAPMLTSNKKAMPQKKNQRTAGNPVKKLAERTDVVTAYEEKPAANRTSGFTEEALRGLSSQVDFSQAGKLLKKVDSSAAVRNQPYKEKMLLLIKGRKNCHARLVEPSARSINTGDCYVLVTPDTVHVWLGQHCNVHEKPKAADVANQIVVKHDLGYKSSSKPIVIGEDNNYNSKSARDFWSIIGEKKVPKVQENGPPDEDESYEKAVIETNIVYKVNETRLLPLEDFCGRTLEYDMLNKNTSSVLIFDFGGEMYVWTGKQSPLAERKYGLLLAEELWKKGYDYTSFKLNPLCLLHDKKSGGLPLKDNARPAWAFLGKLIQGTETILFREKFFDWPDPSRMIQCKPSMALSESKDDWLVELKACDVDKMLKSTGEPVSFLWEGIRVGRCLTWVEEKYGLKKEYEIETDGIDVWHVAVSTCNEVDKAYHGNFFDGDTYVVRWRYQVNLKADVGTGKGGRNRCSYFYWQGEGSSITDKGASALMTIELDKEQGPQIRVVQNKEPASFLMLFSKQVIVHRGKKDQISPSNNNSARLYAVRNELPDEAYLMEIPVQVENLRSRSSFLLLNADMNHLTIWHGARSPEHTRQRAKDLVNTLRSWLHVKFSFDGKMSEVEVNEGSESSAFWKTIGSPDRSLYDSLLKSSVSSKCFLHHAFLLSGVTLSFEATEFLNPSMNDDLCCPFPVIQSDLYGSPQPALVLIDSGDVVYLWQGFWPLESSATENLRTGNAGSRFIAERRCAMETVLAYCKALNSSKPPSAYVVFAGVEPVSFTNLFPTWCTNETARTSNQKDGKKDGQMIAVSEAMSTMMKNQYTLAELQSETLPDGVDPMKLESYLSDEEFMEVFGCDKTTFYSYKQWQQIKAKRDRKLL